MIGGILKKMYMPDQATAYPSGLHINKCTTIKMMPNRIAQGYSFLIREEEGLQGLLQQRNA